MAKSNTLTLINKILKNCGLETTTSLSSMSTEQIKAFDSLNEAIQEIYGTDEFRFNEQSFSLTMSSATRSYAKPATMSAFNPKTFGNQKADKPMGFIPYEEFFYNHPDQAEQQKGVPASLTYHKNKFYVTPRPNASCHGSKIYFKGYSFADYLATAATGVATCRIPEDFETTLLVNLATYKTMRYFGMAEASGYYLDVYGVEGDPEQEGSLAKFRRKYRTSDIKPEVDYQF